MFSTGKLTQLGVAISERKLQCHLHDPGWTRSADLSRGAVSDGGQRRRTRNPARANIGKQTTAIDAETTPARSRALPVRVEPSGYCGGLASRQRHRLLAARFDSGGAYRG